MILPKKYFPTPEAQRRKYTVDEREFIFDNLGCVSEAVENGVSFLSNKKIDTGVFLEPDVNWLEQEAYFDENGLVNFSGRELAKRSGTTKKGNYGWKVAETASEGLVAERLYPWPEPGEDQKVTWDEYYSPFPPSVVKQRKDFKKRFSVSHGWTKEQNYFDKFKQGIPLVFFVYAWLQNEHKYNNLYYRPSGAEANHGVLGVGGKMKGGEVEYYIIFDTYPPYKKKVHPDNVDGWAIEMDITSNHNYMDIQKFKEKNVNNLIRNQDTGAYGVIYDHEDELKLFHISEERAGIFMLDREARGIVGAHEKVEVIDEEWQLLKPIKF